MFDFGWAELLIIAAIALFVIGPQDIPKIAYQIGKAFRRIKYMQYALSGQFDDFMNKAEAKENPQTPKEELDNVDEEEADENLLEMMPLPSDSSLREGEADEAIQKNSNHSDTDAQSDLGDEIREINYSDADFSKYKKHYADCVILSADKKIVLQRKPENWQKNPGGLNLFGGHVDEGETIEQALVREIQEELGLVLNDKNSIKIGAVTEGETGHLEIVHIYFYHDKDGEITGCYEGDKVEFENFDEAFSQDKLMPYAKWALLKCKEQGLIG
jgi:8-oxo-dGTP diphosphatase